MATATATVARTLDRRGKTISTFVAFDAANELAAMADGEVLELVTDDFGPLEPEMTAWCAAAGHRLRDSTTIPGAHRFLIEKGSAAPKGTSLAVVVSSDGLEELLSPLGFALAAALEGMAVHLYFQGPAVRVLQHGFRPRLRGWARPFTRFAAGGLKRAGHIPAQDKLRQLHALGARVYVCGPSLAHFRVDADDLVVDDVKVVEYLAFMAVMASADIHLYA
jgi:predicted peroxiredoxin/TusA-related sulfurtransferase